MSETYYRKGFGLKEAVAPTLSRAYHSEIVERLKRNGYRLRLGDVEFKLAREFGFCYGVDRAVDYAYETRTKFPGGRIFLVGEIIHNPHVNRNLADMGITVLHRDADSPFDFSAVRQDDVVILPAFGVTMTDFTQLREIGCIVVDTTCGSVLNVWKRVESYARDGYCSLIHGKYYHEETRATASQVAKFEGGTYLIVRDMEEADTVCAYIRQGGDAEEFLTRFRHAASPNFQPERSLTRVGLANQTTMLSSESLAIAERVRAALADRYGEEHLKEHFRSFDTICSATQERQDAVLELIDQPLDAMIVIGGYNSSNTAHLATICSTRVPTYHIEDAACIDSTANAIRHQPVGSKEESLSKGWLKAGPLTLGITAGASTPNNKVGEAIERVCRSRGTSVTEQD